MSVTDHVNCSFESEIRTKRVRMKEKPVRGGVCLPHFTAKPLRVCVLVPVSKLVIIAFDPGMMGNFGLSADTYTSEGIRKRKKRLGTLMKGLRGIVREGKRGMSVFQREGAREETGGQMKRWKNLRKMST